MIRQANPISLTSQSSAVRHRFWEETDPLEKQTQMSMFMKNLSIAGGGLVLAALSKYVPYTITDGIF
jgi:uncharacterized membrane protein YphA (DoxX/SURF4 family)